MIILDCLNMQGALQELISKELSFAVAYKVSNIAETIEKEINFYNTKLQELIEKYGERDENGELVQEGNNWKIELDKTKEFHEKLEELLNVEVQKDLPKLTLSDLEQLTITPKTIISLKPIISEE